MARVKYKTKPSRMKEREWKRAQRKHPHRKDRNSILHHVDGVGNSTKVVRMTRSQHARGRLNPRSPGPTY